MGISQNYTVDFVNVNKFMENDARNCIERNTPQDNQHYAFVLTQKGEVLEINCKVTPGEIEVTEQTTNPWSELEQTIIKVIKKATQPVTQINFHTDVSSQTAVEYQQAYQQPITPPQQTYQQPVAPPAQTYQQPNYNNNYGQPYQAQANGGSYNGIGYTMVQNYTLNDVAAGKATIGGLISFPDGSRGIIYFLDGMGHGLAVSLDQTTAKWQNVKKTKECQDVYQVINESSLSKYCNIGVGYQNTMAIINQLGMGQAPAAEWCTRHGNGWYLPSSGELWNLLMVANYLPQDETQKSFFKRMFEKKKKNYSDGFISVMLQAIGGQPLDDENWYWTSSEEGQETAYNISVSGRSATEEKTYELSVRAVRAF